MTQILTVRDDFARLWHSLEELIVKVAKGSPGVSEVVDRHGPSILALEVCFKLVVGRGCTLDDIGEGRYLVDKDVSDIGQRA